MHTNSYLAQERVKNRQRKLKQTDVQTLNASGKFHAFFLQFKALKRKFGLRKIVLLAPRPYDFSADPKIKNSTDSYVHRVFTHLHALCFFLKKKLANAIFSNEVCRVG
jgi:hypothetical protein